MIMIRERRVADRALFPENEAMNALPAPRSCWLASLVVMLALCASRAGAQPNLLVDPGFERNALGSYHEVLNNFVQYQGVWGAEAATISGAVGPVIPPEGVRMLRVLPTGGVTSQVVQVTDVTPIAADIEAGRAVISVRGLFNADPDVPAAYGAIVSHFYTGPGLGFKIGHLQSSLFLDTDPTSWEEISGEFEVPVGTRWLVTQLYYGNESMNNRPCYVDATEMTITSSYLCIVSGACPGTISITWKHARPSEQQMIIYSSGLGNAPIGGLCGSVLSGLASVTQFGRPFGTSSGGEGGRIGRVNAGACGKYLQLVIFTGGPCMTSNVVRIPL